MKQEVSKTNPYSQICSLYSELEKLKEESKILKKIENFQREKNKQEKENFLHAFPTHSNLKNYISEHDALLKNFKNGDSNTNTKEYNLITSNKRDSVGNVFCFP